jgi:hypothetical protein
MLRNIVLVAAASILTLPTNALPIYERDVNDAASRDFSQVSLAKPSALPLLFEL